MAWSQITAAEIVSGKFFTATLAAKIKDCLNFLYGLIGTQSSIGITNGSFEIDADSDNIPDGWSKTLYAGGAAGLQATGMHGATMYGFTHPGGAGNGGGELLSDYIEVSELTPMVINFLHYATAAGMKNQIRINYYTGAKVACATADSVPYSSTANPTSPTRFTRHFLPPSTCRFIKVKLVGGFTDTDVAGTAYFDDIYVHRQAANVIAGVGEILALSAPTERSQADTTPVKKKECTIARTGTYRVSFSLKADDVAKTGLARIYKNGSAFGTERSVTGTTPTVYTEDLAFVCGDLAQLYVWGNAASDSGVISAFNLYCRDGQYGTVDTD